MLVSMCLWTQICTLKVIIDFEFLICRKKEISMSIGDGPNNFNLEVVSLPFLVHCASINSDLDFFDPGYLADIARYLSSVSIFARMHIWDLSMWHIEKTGAAELEGTGKVSDTKEETKILQKFMCSWQKGILTYRETAK